MNKQRIIDAYKNSALFSGIDKAISLYYRKKLKNKDFTILCPNCIGGIIYHRLGQSFLCPTINLWLTQPDFIKFLLNLDAYLNQSLCFIESSESTPVATLGGQNDGDLLPLITLHFNHSNSVESAQRDWNRRKGRINRKNLYIIMYMQDGLTVDEAHLLDNYPCNNKVIFTETPLKDLSWSYCIVPNYRTQYPTAYLGKDIFGIRWFEKKFDFVQFLNEGS